MLRLLPALLVAIFFAAFVTRILRSNQQGDVFPEWSTMRSGPLGAKVLYEALRRSGRDVERNYEPLQNLRPARARYAILGVFPMALRETKEMEKLLSSGGTALIGLRPPPGKAVPRTDKLGFLQSRQDDGGVTLALRDKEWTCLDGDAARCRLAEKKLGSGRVWLLADASVLRNGDLHARRDTTLVTRLFGEPMPTVFDESHLGVEDSGGVGVLLSRHKLFSAVAVLLLIAALFVWRNSVSLLPERAPAPPERTPHPAAGLRTLLEQNVPRNRLLGTLAAEWRRAAPLLPPWQTGRAASLDDALDKGRAEKDLRRGYEELQAAVRWRRELE